MRWRDAALALLALHAGTAAAQEHVAPTGVAAAPARVLDTLILDPAWFDPQFGGISGMDYDPRQRRWVLLSDDRSDHAPARFYTARVERRNGGWRVNRTRRTLLRDTTGRTFPRAGTGREAVDPEAIRVAPDGRSLLWTSEGDAADGFGPSVRRMDWRGRMVERLPLPSALRFDPAGRRGTRDNGTLEAMAFAPDGALWLGMEAPLVEDGPPVEADRPALVRFIRLRKDMPTQQFAYPVDTAPARPDGTRADSGVTEMLAVDDRRMLVLERSGAIASDGSFRFHCRLYLADFAGADDIADASSLDGVATATKRLLFDFHRMADNPGNLEAMVWWPSPGDGFDRIAIVNDNNFVDGEPTRLLLVALPADLRRPSPR